jgi:hypothetical protein
MTVFLYITMLLTISVVLSDLAIKLIYIIGKKILQKIEARGKKP